ncbi:hypothetical protein C8R41DRAFT_918577 [Lentinula lateritia]|uniref:Uncharacterized protein n=1 Tax=Lentinula lateritia TaxID=40482 RepID=A0ABQ8VLS1_9AGAR|nr:hypothetical protein C8R41DRAFT_918577 [Lentinula lateritia]
MSSLPLHDTLLVTDISIGATISEYGNANLEVTMPGAFIYPSNPPVIFEPNRLRALTILSKTTVVCASIPKSDNPSAMELTAPHVAHAPISDSGNQPFQVIMPGYFAPSNTRSIPIFPPISEFGTRSSKVNIPGYLATSNARSILIPPVEPGYLATSNARSIPIPPVEPGYLATSNARSIPIPPVDLTLLKLSLLAQLDQQLREKVLPILAKAYLDLKSINAEDVFLKLVNREPGRTYLVSLVGIGSALLGALAMLLVLAFL